jgi:hypothetical protein
MRRSRRCEVFIILCENTLISFKRFSHTFHAFVGSYHFIRPLSALVVISSSSKGNGGADSETVGIPMA